MAVDERRRHDLVAILIDVLGEEPAMTLTEYLPPFSWDEGLRDLDERMERRFAEHDRRFDALEQRLERVEEAVDSLRQELAAVRSEIGGLRQDMTSQTRLFFLGLLASNMTVASLAFAAARLV